MIHKKVKYKVKNDKVEFVNQAILDFVNAVKEKEPGVLVYEVFRVKDDVTFLHIMTFRDKDSEEAHKTTPHAKEFINKLTPCCEIENESPYLDLIISNRRQWA